jgi:hypothetical protein
MTTLSIEQEQLKFISDLQAARREGLDRLIDLSQNATPDSAKVKALETLMRYAANFDPWKNV